MLKMWELLRKFGSLIVGLISPVSVSTSPLGASLCLVVISKLAIVRRSKQQNKFQLKLAILYASEKLTNHSIPVDLEGLHHLLLQLYQCSDRAGLQYCDFS